jgi:hypothetical protein
VPLVPSGSWRPDGDPSDPMRNRNPSRFGEPPLTPPEVAPRGPGVPPTPQGAGRFAADIGRNGEVPEEVAPDPAVLAAARAALLSRRSELLACLAAATPLAVQVGLLRPTAEGREGYPEGVTAADGALLDEGVEGCLLDALEDLPLPAPPNARGMNVPVVL